MYKLQVFEVYAHGLPIILETEKTSFLQDIAEKLQKVLFACSYGAQDKSFRPKKCRKSRDSDGDTVTLMDIVIICLYMEVSADCRTDFLLPVHP